MKYAQILNNKVVNVIECESQAIADEVSTDHDFVIQSNDANTEWIYDTESGLRDNSQPSSDNILAITSAEAREVRNQLLASTDWTANSDVTMTTEMTAYRTLLRNLPAQADFPTTITWPTAP
tara:strand:+ start:136 stop:501 length:366 start_codon:yes stop_codon:yes gene_type:complete